MEAKSGVHGMLARLEQQLFSLDGELGPEASAAAAAGWHQSVDGLAMKATVLSVAREVSDCHLSIRTTPGVRAFM